MTKKRLYIIVVILITALILSLAQTVYQYRQQDQQNLENFIARFYNAVNFTDLEIINLLENEPQDENLSYQINLLENSLVRLTEMLESVSRTSNTSISYPFNYRSVHTMLKGTNISHKNKEWEVNAKIPPFSEDGRLNDDEISILNVISEDINGLKQALSIEITSKGGFSHRTPNVELTVKEINNIIRTHLSKWPAEIYFESQN